MTPADEGDGWETEAEPDRAEIADLNTMRIRVCSRLCATCIFRPGNLMQLEPGRLKSMVRTVIATEGHIPCHHTLPGNPDHLPAAICRGWERHPDSGASLALRWVRAFGRATLVDPYTGSTTDTDLPLPPPLED